MSKSEIKSNVVRIRIVLMTPNEGKGRDGSGVEWKYVRVM
jgi:hypothetical protein